MFPASSSPLTITQMAVLLKQTVEENFGTVQVQGEISECKVHSSGHVYLTLKDEKSVLSAVIWSGARGRAGVTPQVGQSVVATGRLTIYAGQSRYQLVIERITLAGVGALLQQLEERKKRLAAEGLFDAARKKPLPFLPARIGVITSPTGAVIRDILHRLADRFPVHVLLWPVAVQGEGAAAHIAAAIRGFSALHASGKNPTYTPDVIIVARGGGSVEDLLPFSDEAVVRAVAACPVPLISAVGHETDTTLIDYVADVRAPTPTAAAEMAVPVRDDLWAALQTLERRQQQSTRQFFKQKEEKISFLARLLGDPSRMLEPLMQRVDDKTAQLHTAMKRHTQTHTQNLQRLQQLLQSLGPPRVLERGYSVVWHDGKLASSVDALEGAREATLQFHDGRRGVVFSSNKRL